MFSELCFFRVNYLAALVNGSRHGGNAKIRATQPWSRTGQPHAAADELLVGAGIFKALYPERSRAPTPQLTRT
jgi:hypothetical protein